MLLDRRKGKELSLHSPRLPLNVPSEHLFKLDGQHYEFPEGLKTDEYTHTLHRFPGKFVPQVASGILDIARDRESLDLDVLDPFCGSGTTLVEAAIAGIPCTGIDIDPLGAFLSIAKTHPLQTSQIANAQAHWAKFRFGNVRVECLTPNVPNLSHWFSKTAIDQLSQIKAHCLSINDTELSRFLLAVMSSIIRRVSNADDQTQKIVIVDRGKDYTGLVRRMRRYNYITSRYGAWQGGQRAVNQPITRVIEDLVFRDSEQSSFIQLADFCAFALLRCENPIPSRSKYDLHLAFDKLKPVLETKAFGKDPRGLGIIRET